VRVIVRKKKSGEQCFVVNPTTFRNNRQKPRSNKEKGELLPEAIVKKKGGRGTSDKERSWVFEDRSLYHTKKAATYRKQSFIDRPTEKERDPFGESRA